MKDDEAAVGSIFQFAVGGSVFVLIVAVLLGAAGNFGADTSSNDAALGSARAESLKQVVLSGAWSWQGADGEVAHGLLDAEGGGLELAKLAHFKGVGWDASGDAKVDYDEAKTMWGVDGDGFHISVRPVTTTGLYDLSDLRVAYVAAWQDMAEVHASAGSDEEIVAHLRAQVDLAATEEATRERAILAALGADFDNKVHLTAAGPVLLVDAIATAPHLVIICHNGNTIAVDQSAVPSFLLQGAALGACPGQSPPGRVVSMPLLEVLGDITLLEGDVYFDDVDYLAGAMASRWQEYDVVVIGSAAAPQALGQGSFPDGLRQHVEDGGLLIVFGGTDDDAWLAEVSGAAAVTANQEATSPNPGHPILTWPKAADWESLATGQALSAQRFPDDAWQHVLLAPDGLDLAVSPFGAYDGMVTATSLRPEGDAGYDLALNIFAYYARQDLILDFGETVPEGVPISASSSVVWGTDLGDNQVALRVTVLYWQGGSAPAASAPASEPDPVPGADPEDDTDEGEDDDEDDDDEDDDDDDEED